MVNWQRFLTLSLTASVLLAGTLADFFNSADAGDLLFDKSCRHYPRTTENFKSPPANQATYAFRTLDFIANREKYILSVLRGNDGLAVFCISKSNIQQMKRLSNAETIQSKYIYQIVKEKNNQSQFLITLREGNGRTARTIIYKLDLKNPNRPVLVPVNRR